MGLIKYQELNMQFTNRVLFLVFLLFCISCVGGKDVGGSGKSRSDLAWAEINKGAIVIDVRTSEEFNQGHLEGAINIPYDLIDSNLDKIGNEKDKTVVVYCRSGRRSGIAKNTLEGLGYKNVLNGGGLEEMKSSKN